MKKKNTNNDEQIEGAEQELPPILYHYCTGEAFVNIIKSNQIRLSHISTMNDTYEGCWFIEKWEEAKKANPEIFTCNVFDSKREIYESPIHFMCFSETGDLKSQWNEYAANGKGFAIGFNTAFFDFPTWSPDCLINGKDTTWCKVIYNETVQKKCLIKMMDIINNNPSHGSVRGVSVAQSYIHKHPMFAEEEEWRLVRASRQKPQNIDYRWSEFGLSSFVELGLKPKDSVYPIAEIIIGPKNSTTKDNLINFLKDNNLTKYIFAEYASLNTKVKKSELPLR